MKNNKFTWRLSCCWNFHFFKTFLKQSQQSKSTSQSRNVLETCFMMKLIIVPLVPRIRKHVSHWASLIRNIMESSPESTNSCSNVSTISFSDLSRSVKDTSSTIMSCVINCWEELGELNISTVYICMAFKCQSEVSIQVMWALLTNQRPVSRSCDLSLVR